MGIQMENIILTGYMGSGKTTVGKNVAKLKAYTFLDTDEMIVQQQRRSINEIFATEGGTGISGYGDSAVKAVD